MKRYWPVFLASFCWLLVLIVPATRHGVRAGWGYWDAYNDNDVHEWVDGELRIKNSRQGPSVWARDWAKRFPGDKRVEIFAAMEKSDPRRCDELAKRYPDDALIAALQLLFSVDNLSASHENGPISNERYPIKQRTDPVSPRAEWDRVVAIARRGQQIEPQNCFFDGFLTYGLLATRQDGEVRRALKVAARKTIYDSHQGEAILNKAQLLNFVYDMPPPPLLLETIPVYAPFSTHLESVADLTMDLAVNDRLAGNHRRAMDTTRDLVKFFRIIRVNGVSEFDFKAGYEGEERVLLNAAPQQYYKPTPYQAGGGPIIPLPKYQLYPRSLYVYAKQVKRNDIAALASTQWNEIHESMKIHDYYNGTHELSADVSLLLNANRLQTLLLKGLAAALILGAVFGLLSWRFAPPVEVKPQFWRGAIAGIVLPAIGAGAISYIIPMNYAVEDFNYEVENLGEFGLLLLIAVPAILMCLGLQQSGRWQREQKNGVISFKTRLKNLTAPAEDGLARFDFGWIVGQIVNISYCLLVAALFIGISLLSDDIYERYEEPLLKLYLLSLAASILPFLVTRTVSWCLLPRRGETVRVSFRYVSQMAYGYLVTASVFYAAVAFVTLGLTLTYTQKFEAKTRMGDLKTTRATMGH